MGRGEQCLAEPCQAFLPITPWQDTAQGSIQMSNPGSRATLNDPQKNEKKKIRSRVKALMSNTGTTFYRQRRDKPSSHTFLRAFSIQGIVRLCRNCFHAVNVFTGLKKIALLTTFFKRAGLVLFSLVLWLCESKITPQKVIELYGYREIG